MTSVLLRHCPELSPVLPRDATAFAPWRPVHEGSTRTVIPGSTAFLKEPLARVLWSRRTRRVPRGADVPAGSMSYVSRNEPEPLGKLEEAILIAATGASGLTMPDRPWQDDRDRRPDHVKAQPDDGGPHRGQPRQRAGHALLHDQRRGHLLPQAPAAARRRRRRLDTRRR